MHRFSFGFVITIQSIKTNIKCPLLVPSRYWIVCAAGIE